MLHAHDMRDAVEFKDQDVLIIGTSYSAEDIASQVWKCAAAATRAPPPARRGRNAAASPPARRSSTAARPPACPTTAAAVSQVRRALSDHLAQD